MPHVITFANNKGGVGKTTSVIEIGYNLAQRGKSVLIVDGDSQRSATKNLDLDVEPKPGQHTFYTLLTNPAQGISPIVRTYTGTAQRPVTFPGRGCLDLIPGAKDIGEAPDEFKRSRDRQPVSDFQQVLPYVISTFCQEYDYILADSSPSTDPISDVLISAATSVIAPVASEIMALDGLQELLQTLTESNARRAGLHLHGQTELKGILIVKVQPDQLKLLARLQQTLDSNNIPHFDSIYVPYTTAGWEAPGERVPIGVYHLTDLAAQAYRAIATTL